MRSTWSGGGGGASSSTAIARAPVLPTAFPPAVAEVEALLAEDAEPGEKRKCLSRWCDAMLELVSETMRGSGAEAPPVEEVWHWLAASERLMRCLAFAEHRAVAELLRRAAEDGCQEGSDLVARWQAAARQLRQAQKESGWNADYLRVVEEPLGRLTSHDVMRSGALAKVVKTLLRSLHNIYCTSAYFKEHRMAALLHRILKAIVVLAGGHLVAPREAASPPHGLGAALRLADHLRDTFQAFTDHYFISEAAAGAASKSDRRPATALGTKGDRTMASSAAFRRKDTELGLWRATVRHSLEHAEHCRLTCERLVSVLLGFARLRASLPPLRNVQPELLHEAEGFLELHCGLAGGFGAADLLDFRNRVAAGAQFQDVEERLQDYLSRIRGAGIAVGEDLAFDDDGPDGVEPRLVDTTGSGAEVLTLPGGSGRASCEAGSAVMTSEEVQQSINSIQEELRSFEEQLQNLNEAISRKASAPRGRLPFRPPSRCGTAAACQPRCSTSGGPAEAAEDDPDGDAAEKAAALQVAKRSSWYREPPPLLPSDVPLIEVHQKIAQTTIHRCPSRPRTAQPRLFVTRPVEAEASAAVGDATGQAEAASSAELGAPPEEAAAAAEAEAEAAAAEAAPEPSAEEGRAEVLLGMGMPGEDGDEAFDPLEGSGVSWQIA